MTQIEQIKAEVERLQEYYKQTYAIGSAAKANCLNEVLDFINSLQAEPASEDLELVSERYACKFSSSKYGHDKVKDAVVWGANWQKKKMMKGAVEGYLSSTITGEEQTVWAYAGYGEYGKDGDKVKLTIVEED